MRLEHPAMFWLTIVECAAALVAAGYFAFRCVRGEWRFAQHAAIAVAVTLLCGVVARSSQASSPEARGDAFSCSLLISRDQVQQLARPESGTRQPSAPAKR